MLKIKQVHFKAFRLLPHRVSYNAHLMFITQAGRSHDPTQRFASKSETSNGLTWNLFVKLAKTTEGDDVGTEEKKAVVGG